MAKADDARVALIEETTPGTTPATPAFQLMRVISDTLKEESEAESSEELSSDRGVVNQIDGGRRVSGEISTYLFANDEFELLLGSLFGNTWATNSLTPSNTVRTFTYEKGQQLTGPTWKIQSFKGIGINSLEIDCQAQQPARVSLGVVGGELHKRDAIETGASYSGPTPTPANAFPMRTADMTFTWGGGYSALTTANTCHTAARLSINGNADVRQCLTVASASEWEPGKFTGELEVTLLLTNESWDLVDDWKNGTEGSCSIVFADQAGTPNTYTFDLNRLKIRDANIPLPGTSQDILATVVFEILQPSGGDAVEITR